MKVKVRITPEASEIYQRLKKSKHKSDQMLAKSIGRKIEWLREKPHLGQHLAKNKIPKGYVINHQVTNLYRLELSQFWRMIYTIKGNELEIIALIIDISDHKRYNKTFGYKD